MDIDFDLLAMETLELTSKMSGKYCFEDEIVEPVISPIPRGAGLVFRIEKGVSTFCIRGFSTSDIEKSVKFLEEDESLINCLKINEESDLDGVTFFETPDEMVSEMIYDHLFNRRFPYKEDLICNLSDPGFSWWLKEIPYGFKVYFKSHSINREEEFVKLGPIGNHKILKRRMGESLAFLQSFMSIDEFSMTEKDFTLTTTELNSPQMEKFKNIFLKGEIFEELEQYCLVSKMETLSFFFKELSSTRNFWLEVSSLLK